MRGEDIKQSGIFSYRTAEDRVPQDHPLRAMRRMVDEALRGLSPRFARMYAKRGRPSIAPEKLLRALLLQVLYTIRSERQLMEQLDYNILYRWFVGLDLDDGVGRDGVHEEPRAAIKEPGGRGIFRAGIEASAQSALAFGRAFHGGWHADRSLGRTEKFSTQGRPDPATGRRRQQSDGELSRRPAAQ